jgi:hypothetical protein
MNIYHPSNSWHMRPVKTLERNHSRGNIYWSWFYAFVTLLFPPVLTPCFVARHSCVRRVQSTVRVLTLFIMNATFTTDYVLTTHHVDLYKPRVEGRLISVTAGSWSRHFQPHRGGSTVSDCSPRWQMFFLHLPAGMHRSAYSGVTWYTTQSGISLPSKGTIKKALPASKGLCRPIPASQGTFSRHLLAKLKDCEELGQAFWESFDASAQNRTEWLSRGIWLVGCLYIWPLFLGTTCHNDSALFIWLEWQTYCPTGLFEESSCAQSAQKGRRNVDPSIGAEKFFLLVGWFLKFRLNNFFGWQWNFFPRSAALRATSLALSHNATTPTKT